MGGSLTPLRPYLPAYPRGVYDSLSGVLLEALAQAQTGKGFKRHANGRPFENQPMLEISRQLGSNHFCLGQAMKKIQESTRMDPADAEHELKGAICYLGGAILRLREEDE